jgi:outer membrane lipoprotein-sorting protein
MRLALLAAVIAALFVGSVGFLAAAPIINVPLPRPSPLKAATPTPVAPHETQRSVIDRIDAYLSNMQTLVGDFVQIGPDGHRTQGQFYIQKPGKVRFEYNPPTPIDVIADGQTVVVRNRLLATQDPFPLSQTPLRLLLSDRLDLAKDTNVVSVTSDSTVIIVTVEETQILIGTHRMQLVFGAKDLQLRQWTVTDPQGYQTTVSVFNLDTNRKLDPNLFKITYDRMLQ